MLGGPNDNVENAPEQLENDPPVMDIVASPNKDVDEDNDEDRSTRAQERQRARSSREEGLGGVVESPELQQIWERYLTHFSRTALDVIEKLDLDSRLFDPSYKLAEIVIAELLPEKIPKGGFVENIWVQVEELRGNIVSIISRLVRENHKVFMQGIYNIHDIKVDVAQTRVICHNTRMALRDADQGLVGSVVGVLVKKRRIARLKKVAKHLSAIREALLIEADLDAKLQNENFPAAIIAYRACHNKVQALPPHFECMSGLRERMRTGKSLIRRRLTAKLEALCRNFKLQSLVSVIHTYKMLKEEMLLAADLKEAFMNTVLRIMRDSLLAAVMDKRGRGGGGDGLMNSSGRRGGDDVFGGDYNRVRDEGELQRLHVRDICGLLATERFAECMVSMMRQLSKLLHSYYLTQKYLCQLLVELKEEDNNNNTKTSGDDGDDDNAGTKKEGGQQEGQAEDYDDQKNEIGRQREEQNSDTADKTKYSDAVSLTKLLREKKDDDHGDDDLKKVEEAAIPSIGTVASYVSTLSVNARVLWQYVQAKLGNVIASVQMDTTSLPVQDFLHILTAADRFVVIGEQLTKSTSDHSASLRNAVKMKSEEYFQKFHVQSFERLRSMLGNETWRRLPLLKDISPSEVIPDLKQQSTTSSSSSSQGIISLKRSYNCDRDELFELFLKGKELFSISDQGKEGGGVKAKGGEKPLPSSSSSSPPDNDHNKNRIESSNHGDGEGKVVVTCDSRSNSQPKEEEEQEEEEKQDNNNGSAAGGGGGGGGEPSSPVIVVSVTIKAAQLMGRYMRLMEAFPESSSALLTGLQQLFDLYVYTVISFFSLNPEELLGCAHDNKSTIGDGGGGGGDNKIPYDLLSKLIERVRGEVDAGAFGSALIFNNKDRKSKKTNGKGSFDHGMTSANGGSSINRSTDNGEEKEKLQHIERGGGDHLSITQSSSASSSSPQHLMKVAVAAAAASRLRKKKNPALISTTSFFEFGGGLSSSGSPNHQQQIIPALVSINEKVDLKSRMNLRGYNERLNAAESVVFLVRVIQSMKGRLQIAAAMGNNNKSSSITTTTTTDTSSRVDLFETHTIALCRELRIRTFKTISSLFIKEKASLTKVITSCKWDVNELTSRHHTYIDTLVSEIRDAIAVVGAHGALPLRIEGFVYREAMAYIMRVLVYGYSRIKRCTTEGRASMSLDLNVLRSQVARIVPNNHLKVMPLWEYANDFVKAFYLPEDDLCKWVAEHPGYSFSQYHNVALLGAGVNMRTKRREKFLQRIESVFKGGEFARNRRAFTAAVEAKIDEFVMDR